MKRNRFLLLSSMIVASQFTTGCLQTRASVKEQEEKQVLRNSVATLQKTTADVNTRFQDIEDELRRVNGRIGTIENRFAQTDSKLGQATNGVDSRFKETDNKFQAYREELTRLTTEMEQLKAQLAAMQESENRRASQAQAAAQTQAAAAAAAKDKSPFAAAEDKFEEKNWKEAILDYEKYRKANPKGKQFAMATYKIGVSFQELGMIDEARAFYEEVISKFPKAKEADKAKTRLKSLKK